MFSHKESASRRGASSGWDSRPRLRRRQMCGQGYLGYFKVPMNRPV
ncbi:MAG: hypothetical protein [Olavius algarvensis Gamma 1 endosymbiont]|nr:MAG: hypothetical protein [Olavius algarvensis Gamma 1 endosymbiont]